MAANGARLPKVAIFGPHPLLTVAVEERAGTGDDIHLHAGGQGVWVARMVAELGATPTLCCFVGGETGALVSALLRGTAGELRLVTTSAASGAYVVDRRSGERALVANQFATSPSRHELDELFTTTVAASLESDVLVVCNPFPGDVLPLEVYGNLVADVESNGTPALVDLSSPRLDSALEGRPHLVKLNDWELAEYVKGPVGEPSERRAAVDRLRCAGARTVIVTRAGEPAYVLGEGGEWELVPPAFARGAREGCGDSMMGAIAASWAAGRDWRAALATGAAAGAVNFLRHGLGTGSRGVIEELAGQVELRRIS